MRSGRRWVCPKCDSHNLGGMISTADPPAKWPKCDICGSPTLRSCSNEELAAIVEIAGLKSLVGQALSAAVTHDLPMPVGWYEAAQKAAPK